MAAPGPTPSRSAAGKMENSNDSAGSAAPASTCPAGPVASCWRSWRPVERLQDISETDAMDEGVERVVGKTGGVVYRTERRIIGLTQ